MRSRSRARSRAVSWTDREIGSRERSRRSAASREQPCLERRTQRPAARPGHQRQQQRFLAVQAVLGLIEHHGRRRFEDLGCDFFVAMGRQAMEKCGMVCRDAHQLRRHLIPGERVHPLGAFCFLSHRCPDIGVDGISTTDGFDRISEDWIFAPCCATRIACSMIAAGQLVSFRRRDVKGRAQHDRALREGRRNVVTVADEGDGAADPASPDFVKRLQIGKSLARVLLIGQRVDHVQTRRGLGELEQCRMREGAHHHASHPAFEVARDVDCGLALAERSDRKRCDDIAAELTHGDFERGNRSKRRLFEQKRDVCAAQRVRGRRFLSQRAVAFHARRQARDRPRARPARSPAS